jgi:predicted metal-binding protein
LLFYITLQELQDYSIFTLLWACKCCENPYQEQWQEELISAALCQNHLQELQEESQLARAERIKVSCSSAITWHCNQSFDPKLLQH